MHARRWSRRARLRARLEQPAPEIEPARAARDAIYVAMTDLVLEAARKGPCVLVVEDAQWSDVESIAWFDHLLGRALSLPLFVLMLVRPGFWRRETQRFSGRDHVRLELRPIARRATREIARSILGAKATDDQLDRVAEQAAGSPLFAEELARLLSAGKRAETAPTIEAAIRRRLDALEDSKVRVSRRPHGASSASPCGTSARSPPAHRRPEDVALKKLCAAEILVEQPKSRFSSTKEYLFKHGFFRDVAYAMAGDGEKKLLHGLAGEWLGEVGEDAATVAQHFDLGGRHEDAARFWESAARRALVTN